MSNYPHLGFDPAPGDLEIARLMVKAVGKVAGDSGTVQSQLSKVGASDGIWAGKSADTFNKSVEKIPPYLKKALTSLDAAHRALSGWERTRKAAGPASGAQRACTGQQRAAKAEAPRPAKPDRALKRRSDGVSADPPEVGRVGLEPTTNGLKVHCSAN